MFGYNRARSVTTLSPTSNQKAPPIPTAKLNGSTSVGEHTIVKHIMAQINASVHSNPGYENYPDVSHDSYNQKFNNITKNYNENTAGKIKLMVS